MSRDERIAQWKRRSESARAVGDTVKGRVAERIRELESAAGRVEEVAELEKWLASRGRTWGRLVERVQWAMDEPSQRAEAAAVNLLHAATGAARILGSIQAETGAVQTAGKDRQGG